MISHRIVDRPAAANTHSKIPPKWFIDLLKTASNGKAISLRSVHLGSIRGSAYQKVRRIRPDLQLRSCVVGDTFYAWCEKRDSKP